ncbi:MAG TPA: ferritin-like domain-containing protein [Anaerolineales bacterium]|nr:ferritin-like domain-containing protein [Anaerolineales bacterium]
MNESRNDNQRDTLATWLKDAYAMEQGIVEILERQIEQMDDMPDAKEKIYQHLELTKTQADRVRACVERLGEDVSHVKSGLSNFLGAVQGMSTWMANDKIVKNALANYAIEHFEIASYMANAVAARDLGYEDIAAVCETIMEEEQDMADWLEMQLPMVTRQHMLQTIRTD